MLASLNRGQSDLEMSLGGSADGHRFKSGRFQELGEVSVPRYIVFCSDLFRSFFVFFTDCYEVGHSALAEDSDLVFAPETGSYYADGHSFQVFRVPLPIVV